MNDVRSFMQKIRFDNLSEVEISTLFEMILREKNLDSCAKSIIFSYNISYMSDNVSSYSKENEEIYFNMASLDRLRVPIYVTDFDALLYNNINTIYEILVTVERVAVANLKTTASTTNLKLIQNAMSIFEKNAIKESNKYFDIDDNDVKKYDIKSSDSDSVKLDTISPITRYIKLKALYETFDIFSYLGKNSVELNMFAQSQFELICNGYHKDSNSNIVSYPLYNYFSKRSISEGKKILSTFPWYHKDELKTLYTASEMYSERDRLIYGMPIDICDFNSIRRRYGR